MFRLPAALMFAHCGSLFYMTENPLAYVACDGRKIQLRAACADDASIPKRGGPLSGFGQWNFARGYIRNECLYMRTPRGEHARATGPEADRRGGRYTRPRSAAARRA